MSWINMLNWWQWLILASVPPLVIMLYFLKLRRMPVEVPSTYLWRQTIEDLHVNSIWQRLRNNLLLWLQLIILALIMLALLRPGVRGDQRIESRSIFLIDNSASMSAQDVGKSRLQAAKQQAIRMVDSMTRDDVAMVIAFSDRADVRQGYTSDKRRLRAAIESIAETNRTTDLTEALKTASGLANPGRTSQIEDVQDIQVAEAVPAKLYLLSDGGFAAPNIDLGNLSAEYFPIGSEDPKNVGIIAFTCERNQEKDNQVEAFARIQNFSRSPINTQAVLRMDGQMIDAIQLQLEAGQTKGVAFEIADLREGELELQLDVQDDLAVDNIAYAALTPPRQLKVVLVTKRNPALLASLRTPQALAMAELRTISPEELESESIKQLSRSGTVDLFIYDACAPTEMPQSNTLFLGEVPIDTQWTASEPTGPLFIIDANRSHPLMQYVDLGNLLIAEGFSLQPPSGAIELVRTDDGVLMAVAPRNAFQDAVVGLNLQQNHTNWVNRRSFPIFILNSLEFLGGAMSTAGARSVRPGQPAVIGVGSRFNQLLIQTPSGSEIQLDREGLPQIVFSQTEDIGVYKVSDRQQNRIQNMFVVNLFSEQESNLSVAPEVNIGLESIQASGSQMDIVRSEYWRWLLALALFVLLLEWLLFSKRIAL